MDAMLDKFKEWLRRNPIGAGAILILVTVLVFAGTLANGFVYDDNPQILQNPFVQNPHLWKNLFTGSVWSFQGATTNFYRPLQFVCYWILYRIFGPNPAPFHLLNLLVYAVTVCLVYRLGRRLIGNEFVAFAGALLWALHPAHVESVAWISALPEVGFGFFNLVALLLFLRAEEEPQNRWRFHALAALSFFAALFFKEMALSFPLLLLAYWFFLGERESWLRRGVRWVPYLLVVAVYAVVRHAALGYFSETSHFWKINRVVVSATFGLLGENTRIFFWPQHLNVFRMFNLPASLHSLWPWATLAIIASTLWVRKREPALAFLIAWWPVALLPVLDIRQLSFPQLADRFAYFPSVGPCLAVAYLALGWAPHRFRRMQMEPLALAGIVVVMLLFSVETIHAIPRWNDNDTLINYSLRQAPNSPLLHMARGVVLEYQYGDLDGAIKEYETARRLNRASSWPLGLAHDYYMAMGRIALRKGNREEAIRDFEKVIQFAPNSSQAYDALGAAYFPEGDYAKSAQYFAESVKIDPQDLGARFYLGACYMKLGKYREAAAQFHAARKVAPDYWQAYEAEVRALEAAGDPQAAARVRSHIPKHY